ncbi:flagellar protein FlaG [Neptunicella sp. SCSIO 80796]|uniref:flagellar protein FlaG n=1 Tax=Neptunicella plasticusilytica TaxID=3117012 RepID=UPI003A4DA754
MDIDFSQAGQAFANGNIAQQLRQQPTKPDEQSAQADKATTQPLDRAEKGKVVAQPADTLSAREVETAVAEVNDFVQSQSRQLNFSVDENSNRSVVKVTDSDTGEVIRQLPSDEVLKLAARIQDLQSDIGAAVGVLFSKEV